jgi:hypothetical protein
LEASGVRAFEQSEWTLAETLAWICFRNAAAVDEAERQQLPASFELNVPSGCYATTGQLMPLQDAEEALMAALAAGAVISTGMRAGIRQAVPRQGLRCASIDYSLGGLTYSDGATPISSIHFDKGSVIARDWRALGPESADAVTDVRPGPKRGIPTGKGAWHAELNRRHQAGLLTWKRGELVRMSEEIKKGLNSPQSPVSIERELRQRYRELEREARGISEK